MAAATTSHRAKVHDPDNQEDRHQTDTAVAALEAESQAVSQRRAGIGRQVYGPVRVPPGSRQVTRLPRGELEGAGHQDDRTDRDRYGARKRGQLHLDCRQRDAQRKAAIPNTVQTKK